MLLTQCCLSCFFIFTSFNATPLILLVKLSWFEIASRWTVTNSSKLLVVCSWAGVNVLIKNKFRSAIHLLSQNIVQSLSLIVQNHWWKHQINVWNLLKVNNKFTRTMSLTSLLCVYFQLKKQNSHLVFLVFL